MPDCTQLLEGNKALKCWEVLSLLGKAFLFVCDWYFFPCVMKGDFFFFNYTKLSRSNFVIVGAARKLQLSKLEYSV